MFAQEIFINSKLVCGLDMTTCNTYVLFRKDGNVNSYLNLYNAQKLVKKPEDAKITLCL